MLGIPAATWNRLRDLLVSRRVVPGPGIQVHRTADGQSLSAIGPFPFPARLTGGSGGGPYTFRRVRRVAVAWTDATPADDLAVAYQANLGAATIGSVVRMRSVGLPGEYRFWLPRGGVAEECEPPRLCFYARRPVAAEDCDEEGVWDPADEEPVAGVPVEWFYAGAGMSPGTPDEIPAAFCTTGFDGRCCVAISPPGGHGWYVASAVETTAAGDCTATGVVYAGRYSEGGAPAISPPACGDYGVDAVLCCAKVCVSAGSEASGATFYVGGGMVDPCQSYDLAIAVGDCGVRPLETTAHGTKEGHVVDCKPVSMDCGDNVAVTLAAIDFRPTHAAQACSAQTVECTLATTDNKNLSPRTIHANLLVRFPPFDGSNALDFAVDEDLALVTLDSGPPAYSIAGGEWEVCLNDSDGYSIECDDGMGGTVVKSTASRKLKIWQTGCAGAGLSGYFWQYTRYFSFDGVGGGGCEGANVGSLGSQCNPGVDGLEVTGFIGDSSSPPLPNEPWMLSSPVAISVGDIAACAALMSPPAYCWELTVYEL